MDATRPTGEVEHDVRDWIDSLLHRRPVIGDLLDQIEDRAVSEKAAVRRAGRGCHLTPEVRDASYDAMRNRSAAP